METEIAMICAARYQNPTTSVSVYNRPRLTKTQEPPTL